MPSKPWPWYLAAAALMLSGQVSAQTETRAWELVKSVDHIEVYHHYADSSRVPELKITLEAETSISGAVSVINDAEHFSEWVYACESSRVIETQGPGQYLYHTRSDFPLWFDDRDFVLAATTRQDPRTLTVYLDARAIPQYLPPIEGVVRVQKAFSRWTVRPLEAGRVHITYYLFADAGGSIPAWLTRAAINVGPVQSLKLFLERVESPFYQRLRLPYIQEPTPATPHAPAASQRDSTHN